jgi:adenylate cyclase
VTPVELQALGLWDPAAPDAAERLAVLEYVAGLGATADELRDYGDDLSGLAYVCIMRGRGERLGRTELAARAGVPEALVVEMTRAAGFADPGPVDPIYGTGWIDVLQTVRAAEAIFGHEAIVHLTRVIGAALAKIADATAAAFIVNIGAPLGETSELARAQANVGSASLMPGLVRAMDVLLRQHMMGARRPPDSVSPDGWTRRLTIGFVDLVGSTALAQELTVRELNAALATFEATAAELVHDGGGRLVKLIGDEVMFAFADPLAACEVTLRLLEEIPRQDALPEARGGIATGDVLSRDGDHYGPVVNLAARLVNLARPGTALVSPEVAAVVAPPYRVVEIPPRRLRGFDHRQRLYALRRTTHPDE